HNINEHKATGPDGIPGKLLKTCAIEILDSYVLLFETSIKQGKVPTDWRHASIVPLFKKGDKSKAENYRPVSLTSITCKLLEHIVHSNIMSHLDKNKILTNHQHGFRKNRSCGTQLITTLNDFNNSINARGQTDAILLDFSKAFDKVDHLGLMHKMASHGISGNILEWTRSFLLGRSQKVIVEGVESDQNPVLSGVPQGTVLGPLYFLIYINDINSNLSPGTQLRLFADDSLLYREINNRL
ncbi:reverse transcriptase family protein, partial [Chitinophaga agrisoli]